MDFVKILDTLHIDPYILLLVILSGFFQARYFSFIIVKEPKHDQALKTLFLSFLVSMVYIYLFIVKTKSSIADVPFDKYFISYFAATSLYELLINPFTKKLQKLLETDSDK